MRLLLVVLVLSLLVTSSGTADDSVRPGQLVRATYRIENPASTSTSFIVRVDVDESRGVDARAGDTAQTGQGNADDAKLFLVTAAHTLERMKGSRMVLVGRKRDKSGRWFKKPIEISIREDKRALWVKHPTQDVAVMPLQNNDCLESLPLSVIADQASWKQMDAQPGDSLRCVGFPHAAVFQSSPAAFPLTRIGCLASFPIDYANDPTFLIDYNTFEGDSGGPVYRKTVDGESESLKIIGLVHGQHFLDQRYDLGYESGRIKRRLGLAIIVHSQAIGETIQMAIRSSAGR